MTTKIMSESPVALFVNNSHAGHAVMWVVIGTNLLAFQMLFTPYAFATSVTPPTGISTPAVNVSPPRSVTDGGELTSRLETGNPETTYSSLSSVINNSLQTVSTTKLGTNSNSQQLETVSSTSVPISSTHTDSTNQSTEINFTNLFRNLNITTSDFATAKSETSSFEGTSTLPYSQGTTETATPNTMTVSNSPQFTGTNTQTPFVQTSANSSTTDVTSALTTAMTTFFIDESSPTPTPTQAKTTLVTVSTTSQEIVTTASAPTAAVTDFVQPVTTTPPQAQSPSLPSDFDTTDVMTTLTVTTEPSLSNLALTVEQLVGIVVGVVAFVFILVIVLCLLLWIRSRRNTLSKKPSIHVSKEDYSNASTLALKDPQWRKSLTMALQSMNTHIELPKETDEEMQAVDNAAYVDESHVPGTSSEDPADLTKV